MTKQENWALERTATVFDVVTKRFLLIIIILLVLLVGSNAAWIIRENQYIKVESTEITNTVEAEQDGESNSISDIHLGNTYGEAESQSNK